MNKPQFYDYLRKVKENKNHLRDFCKDDQIASGKVFSEDMLIRSHDEIVKNILPFVKAVHPALPETVSDMTSFRRYGVGFNNSSLTEEEARDNFFKEQIIEEQYRQQNKFKPSAAKKPELVAFQARSCYHKDDLKPKQSVCDEINDSDLDLLLDEMQDVMNEEDISDFSDDERPPRKR